MSNIHVRIWENDGGSDYDETITLVDQKDGTFKLNHLLADPSRIFYKNGSDVQDLALNALMHLNVHK